MSDGFHLSDAAILLDPMDRDEETPSYAHASRPPRPRSAADATQCNILEWLPRLGPVLWLQRKTTEREKSGQCRAASTLLLDHPAIGSIASSQRFCAHHAITPQGPREWICFQSNAGSADAKMFLLPDSDVLAWDQMCLASKLTTDESSCQEAPTHATFLRRALARFGYRWQAHLLEFRLVQKPWLNVLSAQPPLRISLLGIDIVRTIAHDENAEWISPPYLV